MYHQNFDSLSSQGVDNAWNDDSTMANWYAARTTDGPTVDTYNADEGTDQRAGLYSYGLDSNPERALGSLSGDDSGDVVYALRLTNDSSQSVSWLSIEYKGEQWQSQAEDAQNLSFWYCIACSESDLLNDASWTAVSELDFISPHTQVVQSYDGNAPGNNILLRADINMSLAADAILWLRWKDTNDTGSDHALAIDDLFIKAY
jgi:hypothetical protein